jgi:hypothetical protein
LRHGTTLARDAGDRKCVTRAAHVASSAIYADRVALATPPDGVTAPGVGSSAWRPTILSWGTPTARGCPSDEANVESAGANPSEVMHPRICRASSRRRRGQIRPLARAIRMPERPAGSGSPCAERGKARGHASILAIRGKGGACRGLGAPRGLRELDERRRPIALRT